ncbi:putative membrane protein [Cocos nucifera]|uniref:Putative membrane protein n=1 Tax=Cocos nucifera TaxID=13894 RepID=A0A8K0I915_COCNU|nr:putative membrane protein [Cocos nucifera]
MIRWVTTNYAEPLDVVQRTVRIAYVVFAFCAALFLGALKALVVGPIAALLLILGNVGVILGLFPAHVAWTVYSLLKTNCINAALKFAFLFALPVLSGLWLALSIFGSGLVGVGFGFFTPWVSTFEAFRQNSETKKFFHCIVAGGVIKSPYMLFKGWQRLLQDLISREGPFLETACVPIAGLAILLWPLVVVGSILLAIVSSIFIGLYGSVIVYQERSFRRGAAFVIAMVAEFDEYTNDWLYLREGPRYRKRKVSHSTEFSVGSSTARGVKIGSGSSDAPAMLVPNLAPSRSVREAIQEVKMVQIWEDLMKSCEMRGKELIDANIMTSVDLNEWLRTKGGNQETVGLGLPSYAFLHSLLYSIKAGSGGFLLTCGIEVTQLNRPQDRLLDWFFHPVMVLKEQIRVIKMREDEVRFLEKLVLFIGNIPSIDTWDNGFVAPQDVVRSAQIQAISRRYEISSESQPSSNLLDASLRTNQLLYTNTTMHMMINQK